MVGSDTPEATDEPNDTPGRTSGASEDEDDHDGLGYTTLDPESDAGEQEPKDFLLDHMLDLEDTFEDNGEHVNDGNAGEGYASGDGSPMGHSASAHPRKFGRVDTPLRVEPPPSFNAPARPMEKTREQQIKAIFWHERQIVLHQRSALLTPGARVCLRCSVVTTLKCPLKRQLNSELGYKCLPGGDSFPPKMSGSDGML